MTGGETRSCAKGALAVTEPGSRVVRVCGSRLVWRTWQQNSRQVVAALIHEALHTLGLGENPPSSVEITVPGSEEVRDKLSDRSLPDRSYCSSTFELLQYQPANTRELATLQ